MNAVLVIRSLLIAHAPVVAIVGQRVHAGIAPAGTLFPMVHIKEISRIEHHTVCLDSQYVLVTARVQVTAIAKSYPEQKTLLQAIKLGPGAHTGIIAGLTVRSITREPVGPDLHDSETDIYEQSRDFKVKFLELN